MNKIGDWGISSVVLIALGVGIELGVALVDSGYITIIGWVGIALIGIGLVCYGISVIRERKRRTK